VLAETRVAKKVVAVLLIRSYLQSMDSMPRSRLYLQSGHSNDVLPAFTCI